MHDLNAQHELFEEIGAGRIAVTYRARDTRTGELVAFKNVRADLPQPDVGGRLREQFRIARDVEHPNIARPVEFGQDGDDVYITRELVDGESLRDRLSREGELGEGETRRIALEVARALNAASFSRVLHRNLTPANVLLGSDGRVVVSDFGLTRALDVITPTQVIPFVAEPLYAAPEVEQGRADTRSDMYSLGVIMFGCLMGRARGDAGAGAADGQTADEIATLRSVAPSLAPIVLRLLQEDPEARYEDPAALIQDLEAPASGAAAVPVDERSRRRRLAYLPLSLAAVGTTGLGSARGLPAWAQATAVTLAAAAIIGGMVFVMGKAASGGGSAGEVPLVSGPPNIATEESSAAAVETANAPAAASTEVVAPPSLAAEVGAEQSAPPPGTASVLDFVGLVPLVRIGVIGRGGGGGPPPAPPPSSGAVWPVVPSAPRPPPTAPPPASPTSAPPGPLLPLVPPIVLVPSATRTPTLVPPSSTPTSPATPTLPPIVNGTLSFASDTFWSVYLGSTSVTPLGLAQVVCLRRTPTPIPANCPAYATSWNSSQTGTWGASIANANWIWAPGIDGHTHVDPNKDYWFRQCFVVPGTPTSARVEIASDGHAEVVVNGRLVNDLRGSNQVRTFDVTSYLNAGTNCFAFEGVNDQCSSCEYNQEPAGLLFRGTINYRVP